MPDTIHLVKLCVGATSVEDLQDWQASRAARGQDGLPVHVTRMWPRRADALLRGGSLYWVIRGQILVRQRVMRLDERTSGDGVRRCAIVLDPDLRRTRPAPRRPFQGWRYLYPSEAPADLSRNATREEERLPAALEAALSELGVH